MNAPKTLLTGLALTGWLGCSTVAPAQLVEARHAYAASADSQTSVMSPAELKDSKIALDRANRYFREYGDTAQARDLAYIAMRKVELADARARTELEQRHLTSTVREVARARGAQAQAQSQLEAQREVAAKREDLARTEAQLEAQREVAAKQEELARAEARLEAERQAREAERQAREAERQAREAADSRLSTAMSDLASAAKVRQEDRGTVITMPGQVLFPSGRFMLLPPAQAQLDQVAAALKQLDPSRKITIEGHADSVGTDAVNLPLSQNRANAVRDYLVTRGIAPERITAIGLGASRPLVDNNTPENRANNRRVEIVIANPPVS